jgi:hypothetical protein
MTVAILSSLRAEGEVLKLVLADGDRREANGQDLKKILTKHSQANLREGTFTQTRSFSNRPIKLVSSGNFRYERKTGLNWAVLNPIRLHLKFSPDGSQEVLQDGTTRPWRPSRMGLHSMLLDLFSLNPESIAKTFHVEVEDSSQATKLNLIPKIIPLKLGLDYIDVTLGENSVTRIKVSLSNGQDIDIVIDEILKIN